MDVILRAHSVRCESYIQRNANREVATPLFKIELYTPKYVKSNWATHSSTSTEQPKRHKQFEKVFN